MAWIEQIPELNREKIHHLQTTTTLVSLGNP